MVDQKTFKIVLLGEGGVGKTTFVKKYRTGEFERKYVPTLGVDVHPLHFKCFFSDSSDDEGSFEVVTLNIWDTAGQEKYNGLSDCYYLEAKAAMIFYDLQSALTYKLIPKWDKLYRRTAPDTPVIYCGNKSDCSTLKVPMNNDDHHYISTKTGENIDAPFIDVLSKLLKKTVDRIEKI